MNIWYNAWLFGIQGICNGKDVITSLCFVTIIVQYLPCLCFSSPPWFRIRFWKGRSTPPSTIPSRPRWRLLTPPAQQNMPSCWEYESEDMDCFPLFHKCHCYHHGKKLFIRSLHHVALKMVTWYKYCNNVYFCELKIIYLK